jgi:mRNA interferase MazF
MAALQWGLYECNLDPASGSDVKGKRLVLVVSNEEFNQAMPAVTILPLTSTPRRLYPSEVLLAAQVTGRPHDSIVMAHQPRTLSKNRLGPLLGRLEDETLRAEVRAALKEHLDL